MKKLLCNPKSMNKTHNLSQNKRVFDYNSANEWYQIKYIQRHKKNNNSFKVAMLRSYY